LVGGGWSVGLGGGGLGRGLGFDLLLGVGW
jgi:hypothetical protein